MLSGGGRARRPPQRYDELDVPTACEAKAAQARNKARTRPAVPTRKSPRVEAAAAAAGQQAFDYDGLLTGIYGETSTRAEAIEDEQESVHSEETQQIHYDHRGGSRSRRPQGRLQSTQRETLLN